MGSRRAWRDRQLKVCFRLLAEGRLSALSDLYDLAGTDLFGYVRAIVGNADDAEDVFQEVFAKLAAQKARLVRVRKPLAYVFAMARNEAFKTLRSRARLRSTGGHDVLFEIARSARESRPLPTAKETQAALETLPPLQREVVVLKIYEGFTFAEIGQLVGVSPNTAASRYRYALAKLAKSLKRFRNDQ